VGYKPGEKESNMKQYICRDLLKFSEEDVYNDGCQPNTGQCFQVEVSFTDKTTDGLIKKIADYLGCDSDGIEKNACEDPGRVDFALTEDENSTVASKSQIKEWKKGKIKLYYSVYTGFIESLERVSL
jgi:hypothetical protein